MSLTTGKMFWIAPLLFTFSASLAAECEDLSTTNAIVEYVCDYGLVSNTQCRIWREDVRQMNHNTEVIVNAFISWNESESRKLMAQQSLDN